MRVLVTGGGAGIGRAIAEAFASDGAAVVANDIDTATLQNLPASVISHNGDVSDPAVVEELFMMIEERLGGLDVVINNVGVSGPTAPVEDVGVDDWDQTMISNVRSHFLCAAAAVPLLRRSDDPSMVFISSTAGTHGYPLRTPYAASKWAVIGLALSLAMELGEFGIRSNVICPGTITNARMDRVIEAEAAATGLEPAIIRDRYRDQVSMRTLIDPTDIAAMAVFLASPAARYVNGQVIAVDGGTETLRTTFRR